MAPGPSHVAWGTTCRGGVASLESLRNVAHAHELAMGRSLAAGFPADATIAMNARYKRDTRLADAMRTADGDAVPVVSAALRRFIEARLDAPPEFLPVAILDHAGKVASEQHRVMNPTSIVEALDLDAMTVRWSRLAKDTITDCDAVVLVERALVDAPPIFRPRHLENVIIVRRDLAEEAAEAFTGLYFNPLESVRG